MHRDRVPTEAAAGAHIPCPHTRRVSTCQGRRAHALGVALHTLRRVDEHGFGGASRRLARPGCSPCSRCGVVSAGRRRLREREREREGEPCSRCVLGPCRRPVLTLRAGSMPSTVPLGHSGPNEAPQGATTSCRGITPLFTPRAPRFRLRKPNEAPQGAARPRGADLDNALHRYDPAAAAARAARNLHNEHLPRCAASKSDSDMQKGRLGYMADSARLPARRHGPGSPSFLSTCACSAVFPIRNAPPPRWAELLGHPSWGGWVIKFVCNAFVDRRVGWTQDDCMQVCRLGTLHWDTVASSHRLQLRTCTPHMVCSYVRTGFWSRAMAGAASTCLF